MRAHNPIGQGVQCTSDIKSGRSVVGGDISVCRAGFVCVAGLVLHG